MDFKHLLFLSTFTEAAFSRRRSKVKLPDEELVAYVMGEEVAPTSFVERVALDYSMAESTPSIDLPGLPQVPEISVRFMTVFVVGIIVAIYITNSYFTNQWMSTWITYQIPHPECWTVFGNTLMMKKMGGLRKSLRIWYSQHGKVFGLHLGRQPVLVVADATLAEEILENTEDAFCRYEVPKILQRALGEKCLFASDGNQWKSLHYIMSMIFCSDNLTYMVCRLNRCANTLAECMEDVAAEDLSNQLRYNMTDLVSSYSYDSLAAMILGLELEHYANDSHEFFNVVRKAMDAAKTDYCGVAVSTQLQPLMKYFDGQINEHQHSRKNVRMVDFLDIFSRSGTSETAIQTGLRFPVYAMTKAEMVGSLTHWILHSYPMLTSTIQFILHMLAKYPDHQQIVYSEICSNISAEPQYQDFCNLPFLDLVIKEVLRLFPPVPELWRCAKREIVIQGCTIPQNCAILIPVNLIHLDENYYNEPKTFHPERYVTKPDTSDVFLTFGSGPRTCLGVELSLIQIKIAVVHILRKVKLMAAPLDTTAIDSTAFIQDGIALTDDGILRPFSFLQLLMEPRRPQDVFKVKGGQAGQRVSKDQVKEREMLRDKVDSHVHFPKTSAPTSDAGSTSPDESPPRPEPVWKRGGVSSSDTSPESVVTPESQTSEGTGDFTAGSSDLTSASDASVEPVAKADQVEKSGPEGIVPEIVLTTTEEAEGGEEAVPEEPLEESPASDETADQGQAEDEAEGGADKKKKKKDKKGKHKHKESEVEEAAEEGGDDKKKKKKKKKDKEGEGTPEASPPEEAAEEGADDKKKKKKKKKDKEGEGTPEASPPEEAAEEGGDDKKKKKSKKKSKDGEQPEATAEEPAEEGGDDKKKKKKKKEKSEAPEEGGEKKKKKKDKDDAHDDKKKKKKK